MSTSNILRGTMLLTAATFLSKFLGMIYTIPFNELVGATGGALYGYAYGPYNILISMSTIGVPLAVSKFVSKYNAMGDYYTGRRMFKAGMSLMIITGIIAFLILYFSSGLLAKIYVPSNDPSGIIAEDVEMVLKMISFALLIIPSMSIIRGFFQGYESMGPTALSQVVEQIVRIVFLLSAAFLIIHVFSGSVTTAVGYAAFAAFVGAVASYIVLGLYWKKRKQYLDRQVASQRKTHQIPLRDLYKELFRYAGPFVLVGLATPLYQQIDAITFERTMSAIGQGEISAIAFSNISVYGHKLVIIPVTIATGLSLAILPAITKSVTERNMPLAFRQINQSLQIVMLLVLPASVGMSLLSYEVYGAFYGIENININGPLLAWYAPVALLFAFFTVTSSILQGINQQRFAVTSLGAGLLLKICLNVPLMYALGAKGAVVGTSLAVLTAIILNFWRIKQTIGFPMREFTKRSSLMAIFTILMTMAVLITKWILGFWISYEDSRFAAIVTLMVAIPVGALVYLWFSYESTLFERTLGNRVRIFDRIFRRR
ncbi:putative polysaccharide biosynthesis protein [Radiobacillus deserti]|uniref:Polysaccharide biosynthesis protein n=1 Tax=Radiobacillus deserti TaxID=2594883 RepID=A0A516KHP7_9BACI|nr:polysaccharide biosynthesis protein [Radiobacillus deserti]QDP40920.1 polysaccharide biosynthesis protein [Radiobacillus deserti]